jgi:hypothetical protein
VYKTRAPFWQNSSIAAAWSWRLEMLHYLPCSLLEFSQNSLSSDPRVIGVFVELSHGRSDL